MRNFSKSRLISMLQCPRRFWLEVYKPELRQDSAATEKKFQAGNQVGDIARSIFDPEHKGHLIDIGTEGFANALDRSRDLLQGKEPIFEAGLTGGGILAFADVMLPGTRESSWHMIEVKSSTSVKDYHRDDVAIQTFAARSAGVNVESVSVAHVDSSWTYPGNLDYEGLLKVNDLTEETLARQDEVSEWVSRAQSIAGSKDEPTTPMGPQCTSPFECGFISHCSAGLTVNEYPLNWLPRISANKVLELENSGITDLREVPDSALNSLQQRVKKAHTTGQHYFDQVGAAKELWKYPLPCHFLDFESVQFAVPIWASTRPYQQICFQFSLHKLDASQKLTHHEHLDLSGKDPSRGFAEALIQACCADQGAIFVYNASFEKSRIAELAEKFQDLSKDLQGIHDRVIDLLPITRNYYYHPLQKGSWSIKKVLSALVPDLSYSDLDGVQDGGMAMTAFVEAINPATPSERKKEIAQELLTYCRLDTYSMVKIWEAFTGQNICE
jgi:hypothetical protein